jgi:hypothetical protein
MGTHRGSEAAVEAVIGFAADAHGAGLAYARLSGLPVGMLLRVGFRVAAPGGCRDRAVAYAALTALSRALAKRAIRNVRFVLGDREFVDEVATGRGVVDALAIPYVRLRCALNGLTKFEVSAGTTDELTQRARAEVALNVAA